MVTTGGGGIVIAPGTRAPKITNYPAWEYALLAKLNAPVNAITLVGLNLWAKSEGVEATANNPLAITDPNQEFGPDTGTINSAGVASFGSMGDGVDATANFLSAPDYAGIVTALRQGTSLNAIYQAINASPWCRNCQGGDYPNAFVGYTGVSSVQLGSIPIFHGGSPSGSGAVTGGAAESAAGFYQCNKSTTIIGGGDSIIHFNILDACQAKALVGGLLIGAGVVVMVFGGVLLLAASDFVEGGVRDAIGLFGISKIGGAIRGQKAPAPQDQPDPNAQRQADRDQWSEDHGRPWSESKAGRGEV